MHLAAEEFIRRFLQHVLPKGLVRIRHYGFLANACRAKQLPRLRQAIAAADRQMVVEVTEVQSTVSAESVSETGGFFCPHCQRLMHLLAVIPPVRVRFDGG